MNTVVLASWPLWLCLRSKPVVQIISAVLLPGSKGITKDVKLHIGNINPVFFDTVLIMLAFKKYRSHISLIGCSYAKMLKYKYFPGITLASS